MLACPRACDLRRHDGIGNQRNEDDRPLDFFFYDTLFDDRVNYLSLPGPFATIRQRKQLACVWTNNFVGRCNNSYHG